jgi:large subunit ribosomal protein L5e
LLWRSTSIQPFVKLVKNKAYYKRFQVKFRRRREGKTDYAQRRGLVIQDKNKYNAKKRRLVVRILNKQVVCQIVNSGMKNDFVLESAYSTELPKYGVKAGLTNYAACYATGLLCARRVLTKYKLADAYKGQEEVDGEYYEVENNEDEEGNESGPKALKAYLDVGLARTSTGANIFGCLKGAVDGGLAVPHNENRFPGYAAGDGGGKDMELDAEVHSKYIHGGHVSEYMETLKEDDQSSYEKQFSQYIKHGITADKIEDMYKAAHAAIRADPSRAAKSGVKHNTVVKGRVARRSRQQRQDRAKQKIASFHYAMDKAEAE